MKRRDLEKRLRVAGWRLVRHGARHDVWWNGEREIAVPRHNELNDYTAKAVLREAEGGKS